MARTQIVKQLWAYIRKSNLQDLANKRKIICSDELRLVFETNSTDMFKMNKLLAKHILPLERIKVSCPESKRFKTTPVPTPAPDVSSATNPEANQSPVLVSMALANFFGAGKREMLEYEILRRVWDYIKANTLQMYVNMQRLGVVCTVLQIQTVGKVLCIITESVVLAYHV
ncbi:uncharacterized protein M6B38_308215 [Iris pallida]|uniref:DM2 domain-containing protein n=1 Tax=Iris pallida TaxID=29817 RepID=A0AAX6HKM7_IRIPA|nr:uncharacterized protein M6B38_308215 [Iris pallida]